MRERQKQQVGSPTLLPFLPWQSEGQDLSLVPVILKGKDAMTEGHFMVDPCKELSDAMQVDIYFRPGVMGR